MIDIRAPRTRAHDVMRLFTGKGAEIRFRFIGRLSGVWVGDRLAERPLVRAVRLRRIVSRLRRIEGNPRDVLRADAAPIDIGLRRG